MGELGSEHGDDLVWRQNDQRALLKREGGYGCIVFETLFVE